MSISLSAPRGLRAEAADGAAALQRGVEQFRFGRFDEAGELLEKALKALAKKPERCKALLYLGLTRAVTKQLPAARSRFADAIRCDPTLRLDPQRFKPELVSLFAKARRASIGALRVVGPARAELLIDGKSVGALPAKLELFAGKHQLELRSADGKRELRRSLQVAAGGEQTLRLAWPTPASASTELRPSCPPRPKRHLWTWIAAGSAGLLAVAGTIVWYVAERQQDDLALRYDDLVASGDRQTIRDLRDGIHSKDVAANVLWGLAGGAAVAAIVAYFLEGRESSAPSARASLQLGLGRLVLRTTW